MINIKNIKREKIIVNGHVVYIRTLKDKSLYWVDVSSVKSMVESDLISIDWANRFDSASYISESSLSHELRLAFQDRERSKIYETKRNSSPS